MTSYSCSPFNDRESCGRDSFIYLSIYVDSFILFLFLAFSAFLAFYLLTFMCAYADFFAVIEDRSDFRAGSLPEISGVDGGIVVMSFPDIFGLILSVSGIFRCGLAWRLGLLALISIYRWVPLSQPSVGTLWLGDVNIVFTNRFHDLMFCVLTYYISLPITSSLCYCSPILLQATRMISPISGDW